MHIKTKYELYTNDKIYKKENTFKPIPLDSPWGNMKNVPKLR